MMPVQTYLGNRFERKIQDVGTLPLGTEIQFVVPTNKIWIPIGLTFRLTTDATVASRAVNLRYRVGSDYFMWERSISAVTASQSVRFGAYSYALAASAANSFIRMFLPIMPLNAGEIVETSTSVFQPGDFYEDVKFVYLEYDVRNP